MVIQLNAKEYVEILSIYIYIINKLINNPNVLIYLLSDQTRASLPRLRPSSEVGVPRSSAGEGGNPREARGLETHACQSHTHYYYEGNSKPFFFKKVVQSYDGFQRKYLLYMHTFCEKLLGLQI